MVSKYLPGSCPLEKAQNDDGDRAVSGTLPYKLSVLLFLRGVTGELLLIKRRKEPNRGLWSGIGGKLEMGLGESPYECAIREASEEVNMDLTESDLHLFCMIAEKNYEARTHWLMFLFDCKKAIADLPPPIEEGEFEFHHPDTIYDLEIPEADRRALWPIYFKHRHGFVALRADCHPGSTLHTVVEERF